GSTWARVPFSVRDRGETTTSDGVVSGSGDRRWTQARAELAPGEQVLRWRYATDGAYLGRGVYVDDVRVTSAGRVLLDGEKAPGSLVAQGWTLASR
ncbi:MAG: serine hydrolase, partial [Pedococcus sp.]